MALEIEDADLVGEGEDTSDEEDEEGQPKPKKAKAPKQVPLLCDPIRRAIVAHVSAYIPYVKFA